MDGLIPEPDFMQQSMHAAARNIASRLDWRLGGLPYFQVKLHETPPKACHSYCDYADMTGRYVEALIHVRRITGESFPEAESALKRILLGLLAEGDGLAYCPSTDWCEHAADLFGQSCALHGLVTWYAESGEREIREHIEAMIAGIRSIEIEDRGAIYFPGMHYPAGGWREHSAMKLAGYNGRLALPLMDYYQRTGYEPALRLAESIGIHVIERSEEVDSEGRIHAHGMEGHLHSWMDTAAGLVAAARVLNRPEWIAWADRLFRWVCTQSTDFGWVPDSVGSQTCETCTIMSAIRLGLELIREGHDEYWGIIERYARNHLLASQFRHTDWMTAPEELTEAPGWTTRGVDKMVLGSFESWSHPNSLLGGPDIEGCCVGGGIQALAMLWDCAIEESFDRIRINLSFSRECNWGRVTSLRDDEGALDIATRTPLRSLAVRIPEWVDKAQLYMEVGGAPVEDYGYSWRGDFVILQSLRAGDRVAIRYPLRGFEEEISMAGHPYQVCWRGDTVRHISPSEGKYPIYRSHPR